MGIWQSRCLSARSSKRRPFAGKPHEWLYAVQDWKLLLEWARRNGFVGTRTSSGMREHHSPFSTVVPNHQEFREGLNEMIELRKMKQELLEKDSLIAAQQEQIEDLNRVLDSHRVELAQTN